MPRKTTTLMGVAAATLLAAGCRSRGLAPRDGYVQVTGGRLWYRIVGSGTGTPLLLIRRRSTARPRWSS